MNQTETQCSYMKCEERAEFRIIDSQEIRPDVCETFACDKHLGSMMSSVQPTEPIGPWHVYPLFRASS